MTVRSGAIILYSISDRSRFDKQKMVRCRLPMMFHTVSINPKYFIGPDLKPDCHTEPGPDTSDGPIRYYYISVRSQFGKQKPARCRLPMMFHTDSINPKDFTGPDLEPDRRIGPLYRAGPSHRLWSGDSPVRSGPIIWYCGPVLVW